MIIRLTATDIPVMTRHAVINDSSMIKCCRDKTRGLVAVSAITVGWQVINKFTNSDHIVMAIRAKRRWINVTCPMTKRAASESTGSMANTAVFACRHVIERFTRRRSTMTGIAPVTHNLGAGMIDECTSESLCVMAITTI